MANKGLFIEVKIHGKQLHLALKKAIIQDISKCIITYEEMYEVPPWRSFFACQNWLPSQSKSVSVGYDQEK